MSVPAFEGAFVRKASRTRGGWLRRRVAARWEKVPICTGTIASCLADLISPKLDSTATDEGTGRPFTVGHLSRHRLNGLKSEDSGSGSAEILSPLWVLHR